MKHICSLLLTYVLDGFSCFIIDYTKATQLAKEYASTKGAGTTAKPQEHLFFRKLEPVVQRTLDKCVRENGFMYVNFRDYWVLIKSSVE